jgi:hypothetical protein
MCGLQDYPPQPSEGLLAMSSDVRKFNQHDTWKYSEWDLNGINIVYKNYLQKSPLTEISLIPYMHKKKQKECAFMHVHVFIPISTTFCIMEEDFPG